MIAIVLPTRGTTATAAASAVSAASRTQSRVRGMKGRAASITGRNGASAAPSAAAISCASGGSLATARSRSVGVRDAHAVIANKLTVHADAVTLSLYQMLGK